MGDNIFGTVAGEVEAYLGSTSLTFPYNISFSVNYLCGSLCDSTEDRAQHINLKFLEHTINHNEFGCIFEALEGSNQEDD